MIRAGKLESIYRSDPRPGCLSQQFMLSYAPNSTVPELILEQKMGAERMTLRLAFRGGKFVPPAPR